MSSGCSSRYYFQLHFRYCFLSYFCCTSRCTSRTNSGCISILCIPGTLPVPPPFALPVQFKLIDVARMASFAYYYSRTPPCGHPTTVDSFCLAHLFSLYNPFKFTSVGSGHLTNVDSGFWSQELPHSVH